MNRSGWAPGRRKAPAWARACNLTIGFGLLLVVAIAGSAVADGPPVGSLPVSTSAADRYPETRIPDGPFVQRLWPHLAVQVGTDPDTPPEAVAALGSGWMAPERSSAHFGNRRDRSWAGFSLANATRVMQRIVLVHEQTFVDDVRLYRRDGNEGWREVISLRRADAGWFGGARNPVFEVELAADEHAEFLASVQTRSLTRFPLKVMDVESFQRREQRAYMFMGVLLVIPLITSLFLWLLWSATGRAELWILATMLLTELVGASWGGGVLHVIAPQMSAGSMGLIGVSAWMATLLLSYAHVCLFLELRRDYPFWDRLFRWAPLLALLLLALEPLGVGWNRSALIYLGGVSLLAFVALSLLQMRARLPYAGVYAFAWATYLVSVSMSIVNLLGFVEPNIANLLLFAQGSMVSLVFALAAVGHLRERERSTRAELDESRERFVLAAQGASVGLFDWRIAAGEVLLSSTARQLLRLPSSGSDGVRGDEPGRYPTALVWRGLPMHARKLLRREWREMLAGRRRDGAFEAEVAGQPVLVSAAVAFTPDGPLRVSGSIADARMHRALQVSRARAAVLAEFEVLFDNAPVGLYRADSQGRVLRANRSYRELAARFTAMQEETSSRVDAAMAERALVLRTAHASRFALELRRRGGVTEFRHGIEPSFPALRPDDDPVRLVLSETARVADRDGDDFTYEGAVIDVTERERVGLQLAHAHAELQDLLRERERLFASTNHDLRQPLQTMGLYLELLRHTPDQSIESAQWIKRLARAQAGLAATIDDLLVVGCDPASIPLAAPESNARSGSKVSAESERPVELGAMLMDLVDEFQLPAAHVGSSLRCVASRGVVRVNRHAATRMLRNLLANALRHASPGRVLLGVRRRPQAIEIWVCDDGPGIPYADQSRIFRSYEQCGADANHREELDPVPQRGGQSRDVGLGLGLAIVRDLGRQNGIESGVRSVPGRGSTFWLRIPSRSMVPAAGGEPRRHGTERPFNAPVVVASVWVVEDDAQLRAALEVGLRQRGWIVRSFAGAAAARAAASVVRDNTAGETRAAPEAVVMDYHLPDGDGVALAQELRDSLASSTLSVLLLSGQARVPTIAPPGRSLRKPADLAAIDATLRELLRGTRAMPSTSSEWPDRDPETKP